MVKCIERSSIGKRCNPCDEDFADETEFKDHILTTLHRGPPAEGTCNFKYKLTSQKAKNNLRKGANRDHFNVEYKQGATNVDFSDGSWLLVAFPEILKWKEIREIIHFNDTLIKVVETKEGKEKTGKSIDHKIEFLMNEQKIVLHAYN